jgi:GntR family transcriptional regulator
MYIKLDFNSDEAIYIQLCDQIIYMIAKENLHEGDSLPSVRNLAENVGINMHTVNKAYTVLKQEGYVKLDRRKGAVVSVEYDKNEVLDEIKNELRNIVARAACRNITSNEIHTLIEELYGEIPDKQNEKP